MIERLRQLRNDFKDEVPDRIVHSCDPDNRYKIRTGWFVGVRADVCNLLRDGKIVDIAERAAAEELVERFSSDEWVQRDYNTPEDIAEANRLLDIILGDKVSG